MKSFRNILFVILLIYAQAKLPHNQKTLFGGQIDIINLPTEAIKKAYLADPDLSKIKININAVVENPKINKVLVLPHNDLLLKKLKPVIPDCCKNCEKEEEKPCKCKCEETYPSLSEEEEEQIEKMDPFFKQDGSLPVIEPEEVNVDIDQKTQDQ